VIVDDDVVRACRRAAGDMDFAHDGRLQRLHERAGGRDGVALRALCRASLIQCVDQEVVEVQQHLAAGATA
jgi:hypothetical protein